jgi:hypothetical protein
MWSTLLGRSKKKAQARVRPKIRTVKQAFGPPLTEEELSGNLSLFERDFNAKMVCPAGRNQVYIRSLLTGQGTTQPRIALKCTFRKDAGQDPEVFFEHIRDVCCCEPGKCEAYRKFQARIQ